MMQVVQTDSQDPHSAASVLSREAQPCNAFQFSVSQIEDKSGAGTAAERDLRGRIRVAYRLLHRAPRQGTRGTQSTVPRYSVKDNMEYISQECVCIIFIVLFKGF